MIKKYEVENIIKDSLLELDGMISKPTYFSPDQKDPIYGKKVSTDNMTSFDIDWAYDRKTEVTVRSE